MNADNLTNVSDAKLLASLAALVREKRRLTVAVLLHLAEVEARGLHRQAGCPSMYSYCRKVLGMSEDEAFKRIRAARVLRRYPVVAAAMESGRLHQTAVVLLAPHLTEENAKELVAEASGKSKCDIEILLARRVPQADAPARLDRGVDQATQVGDVSNAGEVALEPLVVARRLAALSDGRFAVQFTISDATRTKLLRAQSLLRDDVPSGDLSQVLDRALDALLDTFERRQSIQVKTPREAKASPKGDAFNRTRRQTAARDDRRCSPSKEHRPREDTGSVDHVLRTVGRQLREKRVRPGRVQRQQSARGEEHARQRGRRARKGGKSAGGRTARKVAHRRDGKRCAPRRAGHRRARLARGRHDRKRAGRRSRRGAPAARGVD